MDRMKKDAARVHNNEYHRVRYWKHKFDGICIDCDLPIDKSVSTCCCKFHFERRKGYRKAAYAKRKTQGICHVCKAPLEGSSSSTYCAKHAEENKEKTRRIRQDGSRCVRCNNPPLFGKMGCQYHLDNFNRETKRTKKRIGAEQNGANESPDIDMAGVDAEIDTNINLDDNGDIDADMADNYADMNNGMAGNMTLPPIYTAINSLPVEEPDYIITLAPITSPFINLSMDPKAGH